MSSRIENDKRSLWITDLTESDREELLRRGSLEIHKVCRKYIEEWVPARDAKLCRQIEIEKANLEDKKTRYRLYKKALTMAQLSESPKIINIYEQRVDKINDRIEKRKHEPDELLLAKFRPLKRDKTDKDIPDDIMEIYNYFFSGMNCNLSVDAFKMLRLMKHSKSPFHIPVKRDGTTTIEEDLTDIEEDLTDIVTEIRIAYRILFEEFDRTIGNLIESRMRKEDSDDSIDSEEDSVGIYDSFCTMIYAQMLAIEDNFSGFMIDHLRYIWYKVADFYDFMDEKSSPKKTDVDDITPSSLGVELFYYYPPPIDNLNIGFSARINAILLGQKDSFH